MRILTVRDPWASAIIYRGKDVENRSRNIAGSYRGPVAIHVAAREMPSAQYADAAKTIHRITGVLPLFTLPGGLGVIVGVVDLLDVHEGGTTGCRPDPRDSTRLAWCSPWAQPDHHHLVLANPRPLAEPIPYKGALGLRTLDAETTARVLAGVTV